MKKVLVLLTVITIVIFMCTSCAEKKLKYDMNLGFDFNNVKNKTVTFNVYHSNTDDHTWELVTSFPCEPKPGHYNDVRLEGKTNKVVLSLSDNTYTESEDGKSGSYDSTELSSYKFDVKGFKGFVHGCKYFDVEDKKGEQFVRLYPISNKDHVTFLEDLSLDKPYDTEGYAIDNFLVTVVME